IVTVLTEFRDEQARTPPFTLLESRHLRTHVGDRRILTELLAIHAGDRTDLRLVAAEDRFKRAADLAKSRARLRRDDREVEQVALARFRTNSQRCERTAAGGVIARGADLLQPLDLRFTDGGVVDLEDVEWVLGFEPVLVEPDNGFLARIDPGLAARGSLLDAQLRDAGFDRLGHAAHLLDLVEVRARLGDELLRQRLHEVAAAPRIDDVADAGFL